MSAAFIIPVAPDEEEAHVSGLVASIRRLAPNALVMFCVDEDYSNPWLYRYGSVVRIRGFGVGKALDACVREALKDNVQYIVRTDAHNVFIEFEYPLGLEVAYHCTIDGTCYGASTASWPNMDWIFTWGRLAVLPQTAESTFAFPSSLAEAMVREFGCAFCAPYWGAENYDFTLTACRHYALCPRQGRWRAYHRHKPEWPEKRVNRQFPYEPWVSELPGNPYFNGIAISWQIYIARHVKDPRTHPKYDPAAWQAALRHFPGRMRYVEGYPVEFIYEKLGLLGK